MLVFASLSPPSSNILPANPFDFFRHIDNLAKTPGG
jgi:hypothetical protein